MAKTFSSMTELERRVNRALLRAGLSADFQGANDEMAIGYDDGGARLAMDRAANAAREYMEARKDVESRIPGFAQDSATCAGDVYKEALRQSGIATDGLPTSACKAMWHHLTGRNSSAKFAADQRLDAEFAERFPNVARIKRV